MINLNARSVLNKIEELESVLLIHDPDVAVITETWLHEGIADEEVVPPSYRVFRRDRGTRGGGVALLIKKNIECTAFGGVQVNESIFCKLQLNGVSIIVGAVYRPPNAPLSFLETLSDFLEGHIRDNTKVIIAGDFNLPGLRWDTLVPGATEVKDCELLLEIAYNFNLKQVVNEITRHGPTSGSILDLIFLSDGFREPEIMLHDGLSDHKLISLKCEFGSVTKYKKREPKLVPDFQNADDVTILDYLETTFDNFERSRPVNELWKEFKNAVNYCMAHYVPRKRVNPKKYSPWITREIIQLQRKIKRRRRKKPVNQEEILSMSTQLKEKVHAAKTGFFSVKMTSFMKSAPQKFWSYLSPSKPSLSHLVVDNRDVVEDADIAKAFNEFFHSVFEVSASDVGDCLLERLVDDDTVSMGEVVISEEGIFSLLLELDDKKSAGPDNIPNMFLKRYAEWGAKFLTVVFKASLDQHCVPDDWRRARVVPIYKTGSKFNTGNYRPVSLTCTCCKILEHVLSRSLYDYLESSNFFNEKQHGFRRRLSTVTQLCECAHDFLKCLNDGEQTDAIFLDLSKAFDRVSHVKLLQKLSSLRVDTNVLLWIKSYLSNRSQFVEVNGISSGDLSVFSGVPQGSVLGPVLFLIYVNDIAEEIDSSVTVRLFADDCLIYTSIKGQEDHLRLNTALRKIAIWCETWNMRINRDKTVLLRITNKKTRSIFTYSIENTPLVEVSSLKYLGLVVDSHLKWGLHIEKVYSAAKRKLGYLRRHFRYATVDAKLLAYKTLVRPLLEYGCIVWDPYQQNYIQRLESVQKSAARYILGRYRRAESVSQMMIDLNLESLEERRAAMRLKFIFMMYHNCINTPKDLYLKHYSPRSVRTSHSMMLKPYMCRTQQYQKSFFPRTVEHWNKLSEDIVSSQNPIMFETRLRTFLQLNRLF